MSDSSFVAMVNFDGWYCLSYQKQAKNCSIESHFTLVIASPLFAIYSSIIINVTVDTVEGVAWINYGAWFSRMAHKSLSNAM